MNQFVTLAIVFSTLVTFTLAAPSSPSHYRVRRQFDISGLAIPKQFQNIDFENYLKNPRAVQFQLKCVIYNGPCDTIGKYLKSNLPNWLSTQCKNCNEMQKKQAAKAISFFQANYPKEWNDAVHKYRGKFSNEDIARFESELGIKVLAELAPGASTPKPDSAGLAALAKELVESAKTTKEPLVFEVRSSTPEPEMTTVASA